MLKSSMVFRGVANSLALVVNKFCEQQNIVSPVQKKYALNERMPLEEWFRILAYLDQHYGKQDLGIQLGQLSELESMGLIAYLGQYCSNIREAFDTYTRYQKVWYDVVTFDVYETLDHYVFHWNNPAYVEAGLYVTEMRIAITVGLAIFSKFIKSLIVPAHFEIDKMQFSFEGPKHKDDYQALCLYPCDFNAEHNRIYFSKDILGLKVTQPNQDHYLRKVLTHSAEQQLKKYSDHASFNELVAQNIIKALKQNRKDINYVAEKMAMKPRDLQAELKQCNSSYSEQLTKVRKMLAFQHLKNHSLTVGEVANLLGYQEQASFQHSFKLWTGQSPRQWRLEQATTVDK